MASKQLGKLRQWAGEVIQQKERTAVSEEFHTLVHDIELRRQGMYRIEMATRAYHHILSKYKEVDGLDDVSGAQGKLLPIHALGKVMVAHGEEFGKDSAYGRSLVKLGSAHCKIAALQEAFVVTLQDTFITSLDKFNAHLKDYDALKKKLDSRRLALDAAISRLERANNGKKQKEKAAADEEHEKALLRYEETSDELRAHMHAIQDNEIEQLRDVTKFLHSEMVFAEECMNALTNARAEWPDESLIARFDRPAGSGKLSHKFSVGDRQDSISSSDDKKIQAGESLRNDLTPPVPGSMHSRSSSRASRTRHDSGSEKAKESSVKISVSGWASAVTRRGKHKFAEFEDDDSQKMISKADKESHTRTKRSGSASSASSNSYANPSLKDRFLVKATPRILKPPSLSKKVVRAIYDYSGASDELDFKAGDEILVVSEVVDDWWMGELDGKQGLFPSGFVEVISPREAHANEPDDESTPDDGLYSDLSSVDEDQMTKPVYFDSDESRVYDNSDVLISRSVPSESNVDHTVGLPSSFPLPASAPKPPPRAGRSMSNPRLRTAGKRAPPPPPLPRRHTATNLSASPTPALVRRDLQSLADTRREPSPFEDATPTSAEFLLHGRQAANKYNPFGTSRGRGT